MVSDGKQRRNHNHVELSERPEQHHLGPAADHSDDRDRVYFTLRTKFFQVRHLGYIFSRTLGRLFHRTDESADEKGLLTPYEAIATAVGGSVGFGNIAGVATAVTTRRPRRSVLDVAHRLPGHADQAG